MAQTPQGAESDRRAVLAALCCVIPVAVSPAQISYDGDVAGLDIMKKSIVGATFAPEGIVVSDFPIKIDRLRGISEPGYLLGGERTSHPNVLGIDAVGWQYGCRRAVRQYAPWKRLWYGVIIESNTGQWITLKAGVDPELVSQISEGAEVGIAALRSSGHVAGHLMRVLRIGNIYDRTVINVNKGPHLLTGGSLLPVADPNQESHEDRQKERQGSDNDISDFTFAYKLFAPFALGIWAFARAIIGRQIYIRTESRPVSSIAVLIGLSGPLGAFCGLLLWALY
jgi:hypothetical protein